MSALVSRILLAILMLPAAGVVYIIALFIAAELLRWGDDEWFFISAGVVMWGFVAAYWYFLWRGAVNWTGRRIARTFGAAGVSLLVGIVIGTFVGSLERDVGVFVGSVTAPLCWLIAATLIWRETPAERRQRLGGMHKAAIVCPSCGYNLTGLQGTRCPECGTQFTLDEIFARQPSQADAEMKQ